MTAEQRRLQVLVLPVLPFSALPLLPFLSAITPVRTALG